MLTDIKIDLQITLRCNAACRNCIKFCNRGDITGLDYADSDMTLAQVGEFVRQVKVINDPAFLLCIVVTGGEPLLHPHISVIIAMLEGLLDLGLLRVLYINSNLLQPAPPNLQKYIINSTRPAENPQRHQVAFLHPSDFTGRQHTFADCVHDRKPVLVCNYQGISQCCAADGYIRLFGYEHLIHDQLTADETVYAARMDDVCRHCPFGSDDILPYERDRGCPVSAVYRDEAGKNRAGRAITKRFPGLPSGGVIEHAN